MGKVTETDGVIRVGGVIKNHVMACRQCGACVTITLKQRAEGILNYWLPLMDGNIDCCGAPDYFWGNHGGFYS